MIFVLDASAILNEPNFAFEKGQKYVITPEISNEFKSMESRLLVENALKHGILKIRKPGEKFLEQAKELVQEHGYKISEADLSLIALGLELLGEGIEFIVLTDDFSVQNFLEITGIPYSSVVQGKIREMFSITRKCPVCGKKFSSKENQWKCPDCGVQLKSEIKRKKISE